MASEPAWFRLTVVSGAKAIVKKYVSGINLSDCIGDLITQHLDDEYSGRTMHQFSAAAGMIRRLLSIVPILFPSKVVHRCSY